MADNTASLEKIGNFFGFMYSANQNIEILTEKMVRYRYALVA